MRQDKLSINGCGLLYVCLPNGSPKSSIKFCCFEAGGGACCRAGFEGGVEGVVVATGRELF